MLMRVYLETTAHSLAATLALLALYEDEQEHAYNEISRVIPDDRKPVCNLECVSGQFSDYQLRHSKTTVSSKPYWHVSMKQFGCSVSLNPRSQHKPLTLSFHCSCRIYDVQRIEGGHCVTLCRSAR